MQVSLIEKFLSSLWSQLESDPSWALAMSEEQGGDSIDTLNLGCKYLEFSVQIRDKFLDNFSTDMYRVGQVVLT